MEHFTIFQDFYRVIAEMTEEEIVSAISNRHIPGTQWRTCAESSLEQGEKAANEKKIETTGNHLFSQLPGRTFKRNSRQVSGIHRGRHRPSEHRKQLARILAHGKKVCPHPHRLSSVPKEWD